MEKYGKANSKTGSHILVREYSYGRIVPNLKGRLWKVYFKVKVLIHILMGRNGQEIGKTINVLQEKALSVLMVERYGKVNGKKV